MEVEKEAVAATGNQAFIECAKRMRDNQDKLAVAIRLECFGLIKQGSEGDCTGDRPGMFDVANRMKYDAWLKLKGMSKEEAQQKAIALINQYLP
ncbi:acyl-CoA-binding protein [Gorgonomyces haynaldii]|nr:acyl-CoA-binding protein [Gorgonomyces haynaldii]